MDIFLRKIAFSLLTFVLAATTLHAEDLDTIKQSGQLRVAMSGQYPPFGFVNEHNEVVGFDVEIGSEIAKRIGVQVEIVTTAWDGIIAGLLAGKFDAIVGSMSITAERKKTIDFVGPYYHAGPGIFVPEGSAIQNPDDLKGKLVGVILGETGAEWVKSLKGVSITTYKGLPELLLEINAGRIDAFVTDRIAPVVVIKERKLPLHEVKVANSGVPDEIGIAIRKGNPALSKAIQKALDDMMADGTYAKISMKWIGEDIR
ncbi:ABC transporter substrate-binding protein (plasmid) [Agrobacterium sp. rho-13.3]|uniref:ABC transporter substrate-binding protein n=1 Tax=Agrobacterium sp. rho-13.3 TaxID=3072980 RepID=UPI002A12EDD2|nr:ABC transporter substrate-binding protein [Agrobacterium sp. rho-13.3]MDX8310226.1 ABC transporter substrate-binding protein [Agrobacterium sp. rho-13.3]